MYIVQLEGYLFIQNSILISCLFINESQLGGGTLTYNIDYINISYTISARESLGLKFKVTGSSDQAIL